MERSLRLRILLKRKVAQRVASVARSNEYSLARERRPALNRTKLVDRILFRYRKLYRCLLDPRRHTDGSIFRSIFRASTVL